MNYSDNMGYEIINLPCNYSTETHVTQIILSFLIWLFIVQKVAACLRDPVTQREYVRNMQNDIKELQMFNSDLRNINDNLQNELCAAKDEVDRYRNGVRSFVDLLPPHHDTQG
jgi:hypothetical protein